MWCFVDVQVGGSLQKIIVWIRQGFEERKSFLQLLQLENCEKTKKNFNEKYCCFYYCIPHLHIYISTSFSLYACNVYVYIYTLELGISINFTLWLLCLCGCLWMQLNVNELVNKLRINCEWHSAQITQWVGFAHCCPFFGSWLIRS